MRTLLLTALVSAPAFAQDARVTAWTEDVQHLVSEMERLHPSPYFGTSREEFDTARDALLGGIEKHSDDEMVVELMRLVALLSQHGRNGHSFVWSTSFHRLPLQLYRFDDGWYVVGTRSPDQALVGSRLLAIGGTPVEEAEKRALQVVTKDNDWNALSKLSLMFVTPEVLRALAIAPAGDEVTLRVEQAGVTSEPAVVISHGGMPEHFLPPVGDLLWFKNRELAWCSTVMEKERTLYVQYNQIAAANSRGESLTDFAAGLVRTFGERGLERLILDLRSNGGGDNTTFGPLVKALRESSHLNQKGRLFVLIGRETFSAAGNFVTVIRRDTQALLVGEPTGGAPNQYGDAQTVELPNHLDVLVRIATRYHEFGGKEDTRLTHEPDLRVPYTSADYFTGRDPVLQRALEYRVK